MVSSGPTDSDSVVAEFKSTDSVGGIIIILLVVTGVVVWDEVVVVITAFVDVFVEVTVVVGVVGRVVVASDVVPGRVVVVGDAIVERVVVVCGLVVVTVDVALVELGDVVLAVVLAVGRGTAVLDPTTVVDVDVVECTTVEINLLVVVGITAVSSAVQASSKNLNFMHGSFSSFEHSISSKSLLKVPLNCIF